MTTAEATDLTPAGLAFDAAAETFDARFVPWESAEAQRRAVRAALLRTFPEGARLLEIGGGTGLDAAWLAERGRTVLLTDASPAMVGKATLTIVRSMIVMKNATASSEKARHWRTPPGTAVPWSLTSFVCLSEVTCASGSYLVRSSAVEAPAAR